MLIGPESSNHPIPQVQCPVWGGHVTRFRLMEHKRKSVRGGRLVGKVLFLGKRHGTPHCPGEAALASFLPAWGSQLGTPTPGAATTTRGLQGKVSLTRWGCCCEKSESAGVPWHSTELLSPAGIRAETCVTRASHGAILGMVVQTAERPGQRTQAGRSLEYSGASEAAVCVCLD